MIEYIFAGVVAVIGWILAFYYYKKSNIIQPKWYNRGVSKKDIQKILTKFLKDKKEDEAIGGIQELYDPFDYNNCPICNSTDLEKSCFVDEERDNVCLSTKCKKCGWSTSGEA
jgi:predicted membrane protein